MSWIETSIDVYSAVLRNHRKQLEIHRLEPNEDHYEVEYRFIESVVPLIRKVEVKQNQEQQEWTTKHFIWFHKNESE